MTYKIQSNAALGVQGFTVTDVDTTQKHPFGTIVRAVDDTQGAGEFIYLPGLAAISIGTAVLYDLTPGTEVIVIADSDLHLNKGWPLAVALVPVLAGQFGWFQIGGVAKTVAVAGCAAGRCFLDPTNATGALDDTAINGCQVLGARILTAVGTPAANFAYTYINRPMVQGQVV